MQVAAISLIEVTCSVAPVPLIDDDGLVEDGFAGGVVLGGVVLGGVVLGGVVEGLAPVAPALELDPIEFSNVPFTSTLWLRYFDQLELELPLAIKSRLLGMLAAMPEVPAVPAAPDLSLELAVASVSLKVLPAPADFDVVPAVPVAVALESPLCKQPVTVTV